MIENSENELITINESEEKSKIIFMKNTISLSHDLDSSLDIFNNEITDNRYSFCRI